jgi:hypothetical protein
LLLLTLPTGVQYSGRAPVRHAKTSGKTMLERSFLYG